MSLQAAEKSTTVETQIAESMTNVADRRDQADRHQPSVECGEVHRLGGHISVRARNVSGALMLTIEDTGCGIPKTRWASLAGRSNRWRTNSPKATPAPASALRFPGRSPSGTAAR
ncbi:ATP-binding protein [Allomesorhizobium alhagi]|uniref:ATP-binding protein n=1 Tax=Allomesorhizobium alhagi TaxID=475067 RepID=UPI0003191D09|nr:ATP-binding protein [Mesorhizobium alhagi]